MERGDRKCSLPILGRETENGSEFQEKAVIPLKWMAFCSTEKIDGKMQHISLIRKCLISASLWGGLGAPKSTALICSLVLLWITSALSRSVLCMQVDCLRGMQFFRKADSAGAQGDFKLE